MSRKNAVNLDDFCCVTTKYKTRNLYDVITKVIGKHHIIYVSLGDVHKSTIT